MTAKNCKRAKIILAVFLIATLALLILGYSVQVPKIRQQEFPFTITYSYNGNTETISAVYFAEYAKDAKYIGEDSLKWSGYVMDHDRLQADYFRVVGLEGETFSINLNIQPGYLMGDPNYASCESQPTGVYWGYNGTEDYYIEDPAELAKMGFSIDSWDYPEPIENSFSYGSISMSSEATGLTSTIAVVALLTCMILIKRDKELAYTALDKISVVLNVLVMVIVFPFLTILGALSELVGDTSFLQQVIYFAPALTAFCVAASVTLRRMGKKMSSFWIQFVGPVVFALFYVLSSL